MNTKTKQFVEMSLKVLTLMLVFVLIVSALNVPVYAAPSQAPTGQRLRNLAGSFLIGYASRNDFWNMSDSAIYQETARTEFNFMTPENAMKWDATESSQNNFSFGQADQHVAFAQTNNMTIHGHTLVWHNQLPGWVSNGSWTSSTLTSAMYNHIDNVMNHWDNGEIAVWDVVNEAFEDNGTRRASVFQNVIGNSYIELAFQRARVADPQTKLVYNDYNVETINSKSNAMYAMVSDFKNRGIPIDGVGFQMHLAGALDYQSFADNMQRFANLGLEIYITEMDVRYPTPISQANLNAQATVYSNILSRCRAQPACKALQVWGIPDKYSWVPDTFPGQGDALIFDSNYNAKPAYYSLQSVLAGGATPTNTPTGPTATRTNTPVGPTATRTNTPSGPTNTPTTGGPLKVQLMAGGTDNNQQASFRYRIQNTGSSAQSNISVRVYFTTDGSQAASTYVLEKYYDQSGVATISGPTQVSGSNYYYTVNYGSTSLAAGGAWEFHTALHLNNWASNFSSSNDWWRSTGTLPASYTDWSNLPAYVSGSRVWGAEPGGTTVTNTPVTPTRTNTPVTSTPTSTRTPTPTTTFCPQATAEPLQVEPVTSPTNQLSQVITVRAGNSDSVTVTSEAGSVTVTGNFSTTNPALVTITLQSNTTHHLTVSAHIKTTVGTGGCTYGGYTLTTGNDRLGSPLTIVQSSATNPTNTPTLTSTPITPTATRTNTPVPTSTCRITYSNVNDWGSGFTGNVVITNNGSSAINGWTLTWSFGGNQTITNLWSGSYTQTGQSVSVTNLSYNGNIPANGGSVNFGFNANYSGTNNNPVNFSLNGVACQ